MSRYSIVEEPSYALWNSVLSSSVNGNFEQTFECGEIIKTSKPHTRAARLLAMDNGKPVGIIQGIYSKRFGFGISMTVDRAPITVSEESSPGAGKFWSKKPDHRIESMVAL